MARDDWWTGSPQAGLDRALATGGLPPPGTLPKQLENEYRMAAADDKDDIWNFDIQSGRIPPTKTRGQVVQNWRVQAQAGADAQRNQQATAQQSEMAANLRMLAQGGRRKKKRSMKDAGDALAGADTAGEAMGESATVL